MSSLPTFNCLAPMRLTGDNFSAVQDLKTDAINEKLKPSEIASVIGSHKLVAYTQIHDDQKPYYFREKDTDGEESLFKADMWETTYTSGQTGQDRTDSLLLIHEVVLEADQKTLKALQPRLLITNGQSLFGYRMSCCGNSFSALSFNRASGQLVPSLIESQYTKEDVRDIFGVKTETPVVQEDPDGRILSHWRTHASGETKVSGCQGHVHLRIPPRRRAFCVH